MKLIIYFCSFFIFQSELRNYFFFKRKKSFFKKLLTSFFNFRWFDFFSILKSQNKNVKKEINYM
jgi:hypothetical protein